MSEAHEITREDQERLLRAAYAKADSAHHRLPQFYLRCFVGANGRLIVADRETGARRSRPAKYTFAEEAYYTIRDEDEQPFALAEVLYENLEGKAARIHRRLLAGETLAALDDYERSQYAFFLAAQLTRGERFRAMMRELGSTLGKDLLRTQTQHIESWWPDLIAGMRERGEEIPDITPDKYREFIARDEFDVVPSSEQVMSTSLAILPETAALIFDFSWHTVHLPEPVLLTSEEPLALWRRPSPADRHPGIGVMSASEMRMALSPACALVLTHPRFYFPDRVGRGSRRTAAWLNWSTYLWQTEAALVLCPDVETHPFPFSDLEPSPVDTSQTFDAGPIIGY